MRVFAQVVVRDEADRYWESWLRWHMSTFDGVHVWDDHSVDDTVVMASRAGASISTDWNSATSFMVHEGRCREAAWRAFEKEMSPTPEDWVFCIDADEFLVTAGEGHERDNLYQTCWHASNDGYDALLVTIPEVFDVRFGGAFVRTDGLWSTIVGTRLFRYQPGGVFANRAMGSGSEPTYVPLARRAPAENMYLMHYGYADPADQVAKHARYSAIAHGHSNRHVDSIIEPAVLERRNGPQIRVTKGRTAQKEQQP